MPTHHKSRTHKKNFWIVFWGKTSLLRTLDEFRHSKDAQNDYKKSIGFS